METVSLLETSKEDAAVDVKIILENLVIAGRKAYNLDREMHDLGYENNPYFDIYGRIADAVYHILGERCDFENSATSTFLSDQSTSDRQCTEGLFSVYQFRNGKPELSDATMKTLQEESERNGVQLNDMIGLILAEWALRQHCTRSFVKAV